MLATGTGFAPVRSVLEQLVVDRAGWGPVQVLAGARDEGEVPPPEDLHRWGSAGLDVRFTLSRAAPGFEGLTGRVQRHLDLLELADAWVFLCGQRDMVADLTAALQQRGVPAERVALNLPRQAG
jgi:NAD(P)H-flavin reductase